MEQELRELRKDHQQKAATDQSHPPTPAEMQRSTEQQFAELESRYSSDRSDPSWSPQATRDFQDGLAALGQKLGLSLQSAECRTATCRATVEWSDYSSAREHGHTLAETIYPGLNCVRSIYLKEPEDASAKYAANLYLDCTSQRSGEADVVVPAKAL
jgi:hypothetical protein